jgi:hypothetical protein
VKFVAELALLAAMWLTSAWVLMIGVGIVHADWIPALPTIGFRTAMLLSLLVVGRLTVAATLVEVRKGGVR